tara:strand:- start:605 stop:1048 length:444 start_codon:yes stop_codon:yes gene_type:complete
MPAGSFTLYNSAKLDIHEGTINLDTGGDTILAILLTVGYTPVATHSTYADVSANLVADGDYSDQVVTGQDLVETAGVVTFDANDVSYGNPVTITAKYIVLMKRTTGTKAAGDPLIGYMDLETGGGSVSSTNAPFQLAWNASGIYTAT